MKHLPDTQIRVVHEAAIRAGLGRSRGALFSGIDAHIVSGLPTESSPSGQLLVDLMGLNEVEALSDGTVPLADWLRNALLLVGPRAESAVFRRALEVFTMQSRSASPDVPRGTQSPDTPRGTQAPAAWGKGKRCFIGHAPEDERFARDLRKHLGSLVRNGLLSLWSPASLVAGESLSVIPQRLAEAEIALFLVSADLFASSEAMSWVTLAEERTGRGLRVIPVLVRPVDYSGTQLERFSPLPSTREPISSFRSSDDAYADIARSLRELLDAAAPPPMIIPMAVTVEHHRIDEILSSGPASALTYVPPVEIEKLGEAMRRKGRGLVLQGPSGSGKTTAVRALVPDDRCWINCRRKGDRDKLVAMMDDADVPGDLVVDEVHVLDPALRGKLADLIKVLADGGGAAKVIVIGVTSAGGTLLQGNANLRGRLDVIEMKQRQPAAKLRALLEKIERAANVRFVQKEALILAARGSFFLAKQLCLKALAGQEETATTTRIVAESIDPLIQEVCVDLGDFRATLIDFARLGEPYLALLWKLSTLVEVDEISIDEVKNDFPELRAPLDALVSQRFPKDHPLEPYLQMDSNGRVFCVDMQLMFYVANLDERGWLAIGQDAGFSVYFKEGVLRFRRREAGGAQVVRRGLLDLDPLGFHAREDGQELLRLLTIAYPTIAKIQMIAERGNVALGHVPLQAGAVQIWHELASASIMAGTFRGLINAILRDPAVAVIHERIEALIAG